MAVDRDAELLRIFLAEHDAHCPRCRYNLRALVGRQCPECGERLVLRVGRERTKIKLLVTGLIGLAMGAGFSALGIVYGILWSIIEGLHPFEDLGFFIFKSTLLVVQAIAISCWLMNWRRIPRLPRKQRAMLVVGCWVLPFLNVIASAILVG